MPMPSTRSSGQRLLAALLGMSSTAAACWIVAGLGASWVLTYAFGGAGVVVPHWFYIPVIFAAVRFGYRGALTVAVVAGILAGPLMYQDVATGLAQSPSEWLTRTGFFVGIGLLIAWVFDSWLRRVLDEVTAQRRGERLRLGVDRGELFLRYQPIVTLTDGDIWGVEALVRWHHPGDGEVPPGDFLPLAVQTGVIHDIGRFVLREACYQAAEWTRQTASPARNDLIIIINISGTELNAPDLPGHVQDALAASGLQPEQLCIEVTETELTEDIDTAAKHLGAIKALGVKCSVDDFGTGYSSLSYLRHFPLDILKIDSTFIRSHGEGERHNAILKGIVMLSEQLKLTTVAEGIEHDHERAFAAAAGCSLGQGFHFARPVTADEITRLVTERSASVLTPNDRFQTMGST